MHAEQTSGSPNRPAARPFGISKPRRGAPSKASEQPGAFHDLGDLIHIVTSVPNVSSRARSVAEHDHCGSRVGAAMVARFAGAVGGNIHIESARGVGTEMTLSISSSVAGACS